MSRKMVLAITLLTASSFGGAAFASSHHGHGGGTGTADAPGMMGAMEGMSGMMKKMMRMHSQMMSSGGMGKMHTMGSGMMKMLDANGDRNLTPEEMREQLQAKLEEYDGDEDSNLSIAEFEVLHSAMIRELMVDRFQHLDADGDGAVTSEEFMAHADMMKRMKRMHSGMGQMGAGDEAGMSEDTMTKEN